MFRRLFSRTPDPVTSAANPGRADTMRIESDGQLVVQVNAVACLAGVLRERGLTHTARTKWLELPHGLLLQPRIVSATRDPAGHWRTATTIEATHPEFFPSGVFEYQHAADVNVVAAFVSGFTQFASLDLPVLTETVNDPLRECSAVLFDAAKAPLDLPFARRVVLGPIIHQVSNARAPAKEAHPFCPCCFFTHTRDTMLAKLRSREFVAIRLFAARYPGEGLNADCRVNGLEWPEGKAALLTYAATWPDRGFEFRKQYLAVHTRR